LLGAFLGIVGKGQFGEGVRKEPESHRSTELRDQRASKSLNEVGGHASAALSFP
jgi:hypothetical protein